MTVGEKIQQRRKEKGWSQEDLAEQVGVAGKASACGKRIKPLPVWKI